VRAAVRLPRIELIDLAVEVGSWYDLAEKTALQQRGGGATKHVQTTCRRVLPLEGNVSARRATNFRISSTEPS
jgi:hypothetical protein